MRGRRRTATFSRKALSWPVRLMKNAKCWLLLPQPWEARCSSAEFWNFHLLPTPRLFKAPLPQVRLPSLSLTHHSNLPDLPASILPPFGLLPIPRMGSQRSFPHPHPSPPIVPPGNSRTQSKLLSCAFQAQPPSQQTPSTETSHLLLYPEMLFLLLSLKYLLAPFSSLSFSANTCSLQKGACL